jgi:hypothetical protein
MTLPRNISTPPSTGLGRPFVTRCSWTGSSHGWGGGENTTLMPLEGERQQLPAALHLS